MKKHLQLIFAVLALAAFSLPAAAQEDEAMPEDLAADNGEEMVRVQNAQAAEGRAPVVSGKLRAKAKAKAKKKKKAEPPSEYKFRSEPETPTYKFDKHAEPIVKGSKKKKAKKAETKFDNNGQPLPKLKKVKSFNEPDAPAEGQAPGGVKLPPGVKIPGMGGN